MPRQPRLLRSASTWARRHWIIVAVVVLAAFVAFTGQTAWAADAPVRINQTVPPATPEQPVPPPAEPTPRPDDNNDGDSGGATAAPPAASTEQAAPAAPAGGETAPAQPAPATGKTGTVGPAAINVRGGPGATFPVIGKLTRGVTVNVLGRNAAGDWLYICCLPGTQTNGWVSAPLISPAFAAADLPVVADDGALAAAPAQPSTEPAAPASGEAAPAEPAPASGKTGTVDPAAINVRGGPGTTFPVIGKLTRGVTVNVLGRNAAGDWLYICCLPGTQTNGWVSAPLITPAFAAADLPVVADDGTPAAAQPGAEPAAPAGGDAARAEPAPAGGKSATVTATVLNVRGGPGTTFPVIGKLKIGDAVTALGRNAAGDWLYICCLTGTETKGWVSAEYISPAFAAADLPVVADDGTPVAAAEGGAAPAAGGTTGTVTALVLNVREGPGTTFPIIGKLPMGASIAVQGRNAAGDWLYMCCVPATETKGWVSAAYVEPVFAPEALPALADDGTPVQP